MNVEAVHSSRDLKALHRFHDFVESHMRSLSALGVDSATYIWRLAFVSPIE